jgi:hypothetical protein
MGRVGIAALATTMAVFAVPVAAEGPRTVAERLDLTSFPNSTGPRQDEGLYTFADYGFTEVESDGQVVRFTEPEGGWVFTVTVLDTRDGRLRLCVADKAENGGSYDTVEAIEVVEGASGLLHATANRVNHPDCVERGGE